MRRGDRKEGGKERRGRGEEGEREERGGGGGRGEKRG